MLEKIGLPPKPSLRGNNWVVDASHCQVCSSQFTFINRKHHCRRCGGLFCGSCTQYRMVLRGQGDSPVRICEPCKKLEEAARLEKRHGIKNRTGRGVSLQTSKDEDEVLNKILGGELTSSGRESSIHMLSSVQRVASSASCSTVQEIHSQSEEGEIHKSLSVDDPIHLLTEVESVTPEDLRKQALDEKQQYKILKGEGKSEEALKAFKRAKELERQAGTMEINLRKSRRKAMSSGNSTEMQITINDSGELGKKHKLPSQVSKGKDDLPAELRELGWSDGDLRDADKKPASLSLEGELSSLLKEVSQKSNTDKGTHVIDKSQVLALKKNALALKREGKLAEAKEELKKAKVLEKQIEEQEFLADAEDSDEELSSLIRGLNADSQNDLSIGYDRDPPFDIDRLLNGTDDFGINMNFDVTDEDMNDPDIATALESVGWTEDIAYPAEIESQPVPLDMEALSSEIRSLKREALNQKRAGNNAEALTLLKKAKVLERDLDSGEINPGAHNSGRAPNEITVSYEKSSIGDQVDVQNVNIEGNMDTKLRPKSRMSIQKELLDLKRRAFAFRREGRLDDADEELKKGKVLERQLEEMDNISKTHPTKVNISSSVDITAVHMGDEVVDVTDQDMLDSSYLSDLSNLGWNDEDNRNAPTPSSEKYNSPVQRTDAAVTGSSNGLQDGASRKSKGEIQRELLGLKRKSLALRRQGKADEAERVQKAASLLEAQLEEIEKSKDEELRATNNKQNKKERLDLNLKEVIDNGDEGIVSEEDMHDPTLLSMLKTSGWQDEAGFVTTQAKPSQAISSESASFDEFVIHSSSEILPMGLKRSKAEVQKELLSLKRKALSLRRKGEMEEAEELLRKAKILEAEIEEKHAPSISSQKEDHATGHENHINFKDVEVNMDKTQPALGRDGNNVELPEVSGFKETDTVKPPVNSGDVLVHEMSHTSKENHPLLVDLGPPGKMKTAVGSGVFSSAGQLGSLVDLLTGDNWDATTKTSVQDATDNSTGSSIANIPVWLESQNSVVGDLLSNDKVVVKNKDAAVLVDTSPKTTQSDSSKVTVSMDTKLAVPLSDQSSILQNIMAHKRQAVTLKREGKLAEAKEELRQAKLLEKRLEDCHVQPITTSGDVLSSKAAFTGQEDHSSKSASKPLSSRDRFKLQQESLSHKRQALKLRREGRVEEAEAEFELAKALEAQLEKQDVHEFTNSSENAAELVDDASVEDFLDPTLLSALRAIGLDDSSLGSQVSRRPEPVISVSHEIGKRPEPVKSVSHEIDNSNEERLQLEERIKAEKMKALNLKRAGKQAEALDALRQAKLFEKKLNSLAP